QAVEKFKQALHVIPRNHVAILLVQHENIRRIVNSFRPVYSPPGLLYSLKPYVNNAKTVPLSYPSSFQEFMQTAHQRFYSDFWAKPNLRFPYTISLIKVLFSKNFTTIVWSALIQRFGYEYNIDQELIGDLDYVVEDFVRTADANAIKPIVIFIPIN